MYHTKMCQFYSIIIFIQFQKGFRNKRSASVLCFKFIQVLHNRPMERIYDSIHFRNISYLTALSNTLFLKALVFLSFYFYHET